MHPWGAGQYSVKSVSYEHTHKEPLSSGANSSFAMASEPQARHKIREGYSYFPM